MRKRAGRGTGASDQNMRDVEGCWKVDSSATNRNGTVQVEKVEPVTSRALTAIGNVKVTRGQGRRVPKDVGFGKAKSKVVVDKPCVRMVTKRSKEEDDGAVCKATSKKRSEKSGDFGFLKLLKRTVELDNAEGWLSPNNAESNDWIQKGGYEADHVKKKECSTRKVLRQEPKKIRFQVGGECSNWIS